MIFFLRHSSGHRHSFVAATILIIHLRHDEAIMAVEFTSNIEKGCEIKLGKQRKNLNYKHLISLILVSGYKLWQWVECVISMCCAIFLRRDAAERVADKKEFSAPFPASKINNSRFWEFENALKLQIILFRLPFHVRLQSIDDIPA